jgi:hypothetical protein
MTRRLNIQKILSDPINRHSLTDMATAGVISRLTRLAHIIPEQMDYDTRHKTFENMERFGGGFCRNLALAWYVADTANKQRIEDAFPHLLEQFGPESLYWGK